MRRPLVATAGAWYHGSPDKLSVLKKGASVSPYVEIASAFAHKPTALQISVHESNQGMELVIRHNEQRPGHLPDVDVPDPNAELTLNRRPPIGRRTGR